MIINNKIKSLKLYLNEIKQIEKDINNAINLIKDIIIEVKKMAKKKKMRILSFIGNKGGKQKKIYTNNLIITGNDMARIQEVQLFLGHMIFEEVEKKVFNKNY